MSTRSTRPDGRVEAVDGLKALAMQFILLHHLAVYGPLSDAAHTLLPALTDWFYTYGRMAVQVFLVAGGFLAARSFAWEPASGGPSAAGRLVAMAVKRYLRLILPYLAAVLLAVICAAYARRWMVDEDFVPAAPTLAQLMAHGLLLQSLLDYEALSAGVWYVAIDFQLFVLFAMLVWASGLIRVPGRIHPAVFLVALATFASMFHFNRVSDYDDWALYFFGAYGLGVLTQWAIAGRPGARAALGIAFAAIPLALAIDFRWRTVVAFGTALVLLAAVEMPQAWRWCRARLVGHLGQTSYSLFLVQFPVCLLANALARRHGLLDGPDGALHALYVLIATWAASLGAATLFHRWIEQPANRLRLFWQSAPEPQRQRHVESFNSA